MYRLCKKLPNMSRPETVIASVFVANKTTTQLPIRKRKLDLRYLPAFGFYRKLRPFCIIKNYFS